MRTLFPRPPSQNPLTGYILSERECEMSTSQQRENKVIFSWARGGKNSSLKNYNPELSFMKVLSLTLLHMGSPKEEINNKTVTSVWYHSWETPNLLQGKYFNPGHSGFSQIKSHWAHTHNLNLKITKEQSTMCTSEQKTQTVDSDTRNIGYWGQN